MTCKIPHKINQRFFGANNATIHGKRFTYACSINSLEIINQMVTLYQADLEIVGVSTADGLSGEVDRKMSQILRYYTKNGITALVRSVSQSSLEAFAAQTSRE